METKRLQPRTREGIVLKDKMDQTRIVVVTRLFRHPRFQKVIKKRVKYAVHDAKNETHVGDRVRILGARPFSGTKHWRIIELIKKAGVTSAH